MKILMCNALKEMKIVLCLSLFLFLAFSCSGERPKGKGKKQDKADYRKERKGRESKKVVPKVLAKRLEYTSAQVTISSFGKVEAYHKLDVVSEVGGKIIDGDVVLKPGSSFKKGELLLTIDSEEASYAFKARVSNYLNRLAQVLPDIKIDFSNKYTDWAAHFEAIDLNKDLPELPKISSTQENTFFASQGILSDYYALKSEEARLKKYKIRAPFNGHILDVLLEKGMVANMGSRVLSILSDDEKEVSFPLTLKDLEYVKIGQSVEIKNEKTEHKWRGKVARIGAQVKANTQSVDVYVRIEDGQKLKDGSYVNGVIQASKIKDVFALPAVALLSDQSVYCIYKSVLHKHDVEVVHSDAKTVWIRLLGTDGKAEVMVVMESLLNAVEGMEVEIR